MKIELRELQEQVKKVLSKKRYFHTLGVQYTAANLAMRYDLDIEKASIAGLLHDCAKSLTDEKLLEKCKKHQISIRKIEERNPYLLHAKLGGYYAIHQYGITDEEIVQAIIYHTTGKPKMNLLEKIVFVADYIEPGRKEVSGMKEIRHIAYIDLDKTVYLILENTLSYLKGEEIKKEIDPVTEEAYQYYKNLQNER